MSLEDYSTPEKLKIKNTGDFNKAIESGDMDSAMLFLRDVKNNREKYPQYDERWIDHREREVFKSWRKRASDATNDDEKDKYLQCANQVIEDMNNNPHASNSQSRDGRIKVLSQEMEF